MNTEEINRFVQRFTEMFNKPDIDIADEIFAPNFLAHLPLAPILDLPNFKSFVQGFYDAIPDFWQEVNDSILAGDRLVLRVTYHGTHRGDFMGISPTGREMTMPGIGIFRIENGLIVENWAEIDVFGVLQQVSEVESPSPKITHESLFDVDQRLYRFTN